MFNKISNNILLLALVSLIILFFNQSEINRDGVLYLTQAQYFLEGNMEKAMQVYRWPFYSILIFKVKQYSGLSIQNSAHAINIFLFLGASFYYFKNIEILTLNKISPVFGLLTLLTSISIMDDYLVMVLRDQGLWCFFMAGVFFYLRWSKNQLWQDAIFWQLSFFLGALFRPELLIFNIFLPIISPFILRSNNVKRQFFQSISLIILIFSLVIFYLILKQNSIYKIEFSRLAEFISRPQHFFNSMFEPLDVDIKDYYLRLLIEDYITSFKYLFLSYVLLFKWITGLGLIHFVIFIYAIKKKFLKGQDFKVLTTFFVLSAFIPIINLFATNILSSRYWVMNWWIVLIFVAVGLNHLLIHLTKHNTPRDVWLRWALIFFLTINVFNIFIDKPEVIIDKQVSNWIKDNNLDLNNIYFNDHRIAYYSGILPYTPEDINKALTVIKYQYIIYKYKRNEQAHDFINYKAINYFPNKSKPKIIIYERLV